MRNNEPVFFSTWGFDYFPPVNLDDEKIINESGSSIPYKFVVEKINDEFEVIDSRIPRDGSYYPKDIKSIFPRNVRKQIEDVHQDGTVKRLSLENQQKAEFYFTK